MNATTPVRRNARGKIENIERAHGASIRDLLLRLYSEGKSQREIADFLGVSQSTVSQYTRSSQITINVVRQIEGTQS